MGKTVLYCVLNWGLGHASRSVPVIRELLNQGLKVVVASDGRSLLYLKKSFPQLKFEELSPYPIEYPRKGSMKLKMLGSIKRLVEVVKLEHEEVANLVSKHSISGIISDNRYGAYYKGVPNIFIGHQLTIQAGLVTSMVNKINHRWLNKFDEIWVPDNSTEKNLSGKLSHPVPYTISSVVRHIGLLSRFEQKTNRNRRFEITAVLSGPEPQRTILEESLIQLMVDFKTNNAIIAGKPELDQNDSMPNLKMYSHLPDAKFEEILGSSRVVISRPGYSSLMDYLVLGVKVVLIPTPGQTEQMFLAKRCQELFGIPMIPQNKLSYKTLRLAIREAKAIPEFTNESQLKKVISFFRVTLK